MPVQRRPRPYESLGPSYKRSAVYRTHSVGALESDRCLSNVYSMQPAEMVRVAVDMDMATFDPNNLVAGASRRLSTSVTPGLLTMDDAGSPCGLLATGFEADASRALVTLADGLVLHNGRRVDAELVRRNLLRVLDPGSGCYQRADLAVVEDIGVVDDLTLRLGLREPFAPLLSLLANHIGITDPDTAGTAALPVGAGAYRVVEWTRGAGMRLVRSDRGPAEAPASVDWVVEPDGLRRAQGLLDGRFDAVWMPDAGRLDELRALGCTVTVRPSQAPTHLTFNFDREPWKDPAVRRAVAHAIDRRALTRELFGRAGVASWTPYAPGSPWCAPLPEPAYDPDHARWLLRRAGRDRIDDVLPVDGAFGLRMGGILARQLDAVGIHLTPRSHESHRWWPGFYTSGDWGIILQTWTPMPDPDQLLARRYHSAGILNAGRYRSRAMDDALVTGRREAAAERRYGAYERAQQLILDDAAGVYLFHAPMITAARPGVLGFEPTALSELRLDAIRFARPAPNRTRGSYTNETDTQPGADQF